MKVFFEPDAWRTVGNLIDQFTLGFVTDFIAVGRFPIFNIADSGVTVGVGLMLLDMLIKEKRLKIGAEKANRSGCLSYAIKGKPQSGSTSSSRNLSLGSFARYRSSN